MAACKNQLADRNSNSDSLLFIRSILTSGSWHPIFTHQTSMCFQTLDTMESRWNPAKSAFLWVKSTELNSQAAPQPCLPTSRSVLHRTRFQCHDDRWCRPGKIGKAAKSGRLWRRKWENMVILRDFTWFCYDKWHILHFILLDCYILLWILSWNNHTKLPCPSC